MSIPGTRDFDHGLLGGLGSPTNYWLAHLVADFLGRWLAE